MKKWGEIREEVFRTRVGGTHGGATEISLRLDTERDILFVATRHRHIAAAVDCGPEGAWAERYLPIEVLTAVASTEPSPCWPEEGAAERRRRIRRRIEDRLRKLPDDDDQLMLIASILGTETV
jgi:hypothetical protein